MVLVTLRSDRSDLLYILEGERGPDVLAKLCRRRLRSKIPKLTEALTGRFNEHRGYPARLHLNLIEQHSAGIEKITCRIEVMPFRQERDLIVAIAGIRTSVADVIAAETGGDMSQFPTAGHLA